VIDATDLRHAFGHFATGVTVVSSYDADGDPVGTTANAVTSVSLDPPQLLVCFNRESATLAALRRHGTFAVSILSEHQRELSVNFSKPGATAVWAEVSADALATLECDVDRVLDGGDHEIVIGTVRQVAVGEHGHPPLVFFRGAYTRLESAA
jgi:3-hydroxy-9,10-secoandrosta-1,3,5(10)-triene-9,17-dione monooxygenase reductase component